MLILYYSNIFLISYQNNLFILDIDIYLVSKMSHLCDDMNSRQLPTSLTPQPILGVEMQVCMENNKKRRI